MIDAATQERFGRNREVIRELVSNTVPIRRNLVASNVVVGDNDDTTTRRLKWEWATDETARDVPDELVQGLLVRGGVSLLYGDSNSGKTFLALDIAAAVARGAQWFDRHVEPGLVVYLASESPASPRTRLQAYRTAFKCETPNIVIVSSPVDLFNGDGDKDDIVNLVKEIEGKTHKTCQFIIADTLARVSAGANENSGEDMGRVIKRVDALREATGAHVMLIHHAGKDQAKGARGWSGLRAAVDTEIEVTADDATGLRCAEVTKQRDIAGKGTRIGFQLEQVNLGTTKWGEPFTSCVVQPTNAPVKQTRNKRVSEIGGAIVEFLSQGDTAVKRTNVVNHIVESHGCLRQSVYKQIEALKAAGRLIEFAGAVRLVKETAMSPEADRRQGDTATPVHRPATMTEGIAASDASSNPEDLSPMSPTVAQATNGDSRQTEVQMSPMSPLPYRGGDKGDNTEPRANVS
ncbi:helicase RepA family protein [Solimonas soli]|uniref:helicase RepA family protein n=1 Tax=Solimonas soli TaxID=413479 RepID=UPI0004B8D125|nr:helicase RepA family protein [Solimonas soli]